ncbi:hypothetical protein F5146DRAFT_1034857 [Armillaria mellea]|nr:hypothetical protein F5146DRAFT_1034857 [Armillaria mellea]
MLSLPLVLLSLHALAVYSSPPKDSEDVAVLRRGGMIQGLTLRREEYHQLQKRAVSICGVPARDARNSDCTKRYPSTLTKRTGSSQSSSSGGGHDSSSPSQYTGHTSSTQQRQDEQDDDDMAEYENEQSLGNHCDHLIELQVVEGVLYNHCGSISTRRATNIKNYLNDGSHNLYLIRGDVNLAKGAATKRAILRRQDGRSLTYRSSFEQHTWQDVVAYLQAKRSVARTNAAWIEQATGVQMAFAKAIREIYSDTLAIAEAMVNSYVSSQQGSSSPHSQGSSGGSSGVSDPPAETTYNYNGRLMTLYEMDNAYYYAHYDGQNYHYMDFTTQNLRDYPPVYQ